MNDFRAILPATILLVVSAAGRFVSMAGLAPEKYEAVLIAYLRTGSRTNIFLIQYVAFPVVLFLLFTAKPKQVKLFVAAAFLLALVSIARYFVPIFVVSMVGDALVVWWLSTVLRSRTNEMA